MLQMLEKLPAQAIYNRPWSDDATGISTTVADNDFNIIFLTKASLFEAGIKCVIDTLSLTHFRLETLVYLFLPFVLYIFLLQIGLTKWNRPIELHRLTVWQNHENES